MRISGVVPKIGCLAALAALAACADTPTAGPAEPLQGVSAAADSVSPAPDTIIYEGEQEFEEIAREVPGYAGHWYTDKGDRVIALTDPSQQALAVRVIDARPQPEPADGEVRTGATQFVTVRNDFATLRNWRNAATFPVLGVKGAVAVDLDEERNAVTVFLADESARAGVEAELGRAGVPLHAAIVEVAGAPEAFQTLQNFFRPLQSGYQIRNGVGATCTLGPPGLTTTPTYITNSHCTTTYWGNTANPFYQHAIAGAWFIGNEVLDPPGWWCGGGWLCRWSDAALIRVAPNVPAANQIARTTGWGIHWAPGSINNGGLPAWNVLNPPLWWPGVGQVVDKVGRTTGWNRGIVTNSCVNFAAPPPAPPGRAVLCQYLMTNMAGPGDSGSPVFRQLIGNRAQVTGVLWGGIVTPWFKRSIFSPRGGVFTDLGV
jgi:hypothetical protein